MLSRRDLVGKLAAGTAVIWAAGAARISSASTRPEPSAPAGSGPPGPAAEAEARPPIVDAGPPADLSAPAPWELLRPLTLGAVVAHGWRVAGFTGAVDGSCVLTLENERGRTRRVHLCRNDGSPQGLVYTKRFDLIVMNGGVGELPTEESLAQAVAAVAHVLAVNESDRRHDPVVDALLPHAERVRLFTGPLDRRLI